jgi:hypothetical protein
MVASPTSYSRASSAIKIRGRFIGVAIGAFSAWLNGVRRGHPSKMSSRQKQETPRRGLGGTHSMTDVENLSQTGPRRARQRYLIAAKL